MSTTSEPSLAVGRLAALAAHLNAHKFTTDLTQHGLTVRNPELPACCADAGRALGDTITCQRRSADGGALWFFTSWQEPIARADQVTEAVTAIKGYLAVRA